MFKPGPWNIREVQDPESFRPSITYAIDSGEEQVAYCVHDESSARLIAVAPQLLLALEDAATIFRGLVDVVPLLRERVEAYDNLIAKARG